MRVAYVVYNERPGSGLMRTQVVSLLKEMKRRSPALDLHLLAFWQPWVARKFKDEIERMRADLAQAGIEQHDYPWVIIPSRYFLYKPALFPVLHTWVSWIFRRVLRARYDVVHCRGYVASYVATELKPRFGHRVVFDMRSLYAKEHVTIGAWRAGDPIDRMWLAIESFTARQADAAIGVSEAMVDEIRRIAPEGRAVHVPICVDLEAFQFDPARRARLRSELGWEQNPVIAYQGSLGLMNSNLAEVAEYLAAILRVLPAVRFLIMTSNQTVDVPGVLAKFGIPPESYAVRHPGKGELAGFLSAADAGIHAMSPGPDSATRLGVKIVEYLSCSLPIIVNEHVGAAADLVRRHGVGFIARLDEPEVLKSQLANLLSATPMPSERSRSLASNVFSLQSCADRYLSLYREIVGAGGRA